VTPLLGIISLLVLIMTFMAFLSIGMLSASFIMVFKQGNPIKFIFGSSSYFLGGILFPVEVLPKPFQVIAAILPITHAVKALRELLLARVGFHEIIPLLLNLTIFIALVAPVSILFFRYAVQRAKKDGSLIQF
jgi:ABC-2 type transport system permease protein